MRQAGPNALLLRRDLRPGCANEPIKDENGPANPNNGIESDGHAFPLLGMLILVSFQWTVLLFREGITTEFTIISHKNIAVGTGRSSPGEFIFKQWRGGFNQMNTAKLLISGRSQMRPN